MSASLPPVPRVALGVSADTLERHGAVAGVRVWRLGSIRLAAVDELRRLVDDNAERVPGGELERRAA